MKIFPIIIGLFFINPLSLIAQLTFGGGNTSTRPVVKKTASEAPTPDDITQLLNEVTYLTYNAGFPVRMSNLSPKEASSLQKINQLGIVKMVSGGNGVYSLSTTTKGQTYFIEKQDETLIYGAALGKFNSLLRLHTHPTKAGVYVAEGSLDILRVSPLGELFGLRRGKPTTFKVEVIYDLISEGWVVNLDALQDVTPYTACKYGLWAYAYVQFYENFGAVVSGTFTSANGKRTYIFTPDYSNNNTGSYTFQKNKKIKTGMYVLDKEQEAIILDGEAHRIQPGNANGSLAIFPPSGVAWDARYFRQFSEKDIKKMRQELPNTIWHLRGNPNYSLEFTVNNQMALKTPKGEFRGTWSISNEHQFAYTIEGTKPTDILHYDGALMIFGDKKYNLFGSNGSQTWERFEGISGN